MRLDVNAVAELRALMGEEFDALIESFESDSRTQIEAIDAAVARADADRLRRQAHSLRGACVNLGANDLAELCERIEMLGRNGDCAKARSLLPALRDEFDGVRESLAGFVRH